MTATDRILFGRILLPLTHGGLIGVSVARIALGLPSLMARFRVTSYERVNPNRNLTQHDFV